MVANLRNRGVFGKGDLRVVELFANQAAVALEYSRVRDELRKLAVVEDRERIGRELHDGVIQSLFAVGMNLQAAATIAGPGEVRERLEKAVTELDRAILDLRNYIFGLRPGILADRQLGPVIAQLAADLEDKSEITVAVEIDPQLAAELSAAAGDIVQLVRESLSNVARHSGALTCRVSLLREDGIAMLVIEDDGRGFDAAVPSAGQGLGNLRDRSRKLGGRLSITSGGEGTRVEIRLPL
jgi:signal transduction histidine kinase